MNKSAKIAELRHSLAQYDLTPGRPAVALGHAGADSVLGGGLKTGALHEVFAEGWGGSGFALLLSLLMTSKTSGPLFWVRSDYAALEYGGPAAEGIAALIPGAVDLVMVRAAQPAEALAAAADILACPHVGCLLLEIEGDPRLLDLTASRRLALAAETSGVGLVLLREGARETPSAAHTRWRARAAPSRSDDDDWGRPRFDTELVRHRMGGLGRFLMEWDPQAALFIDLLPSQLGSASADTSLVRTLPLLTPLPLALRARGRGV